MSQYRNHKVHSAAIAAALSTLLYASGAKAEDAQNAPATEEAALPALPENLARVPAPYVAPPVNRKKPELVHVELEAKPAVVAPVNRRASAAKISHREGEKWELARATGQTSLHI